VKKRNNFYLHLMDTNPVRNFYAAVPDNFLSDSPLPSALVEALKIHGWQDPEGKVWWDPDFHLDPVLDEDGGVHLCVDTSEALAAMRFAERCQQARSLMKS